MKNICLLVWIYSVVFFSCSQEKNNKYFSGNLGDFADANSAAKFDSAIIKNMILSVKLYDIVNYNSFDDSTIGFASLPSIQFGRYKWMLNNCSIDQLVELSEHKNVVVRAYSIKALKEKNYNGLVQIFRQQRKDSSAFMHFSGCIGLPVKYNAYFFSLVKDQLSHEERKRFFKEIPKRI
jgi:hypothetical protein